jgi:hypothetical protein
MDQDQLPLPENWPGKRIAEEMIAIELEEILRLIEQSKDQSQQQ